MSRRTTNSNAPRWMDINKERARLIEELQEITTPKTAGEFSRRANATIRLISSGSKPEEAGQELNTLIEVVIDLVNIARQEQQGSVSESESAVSRADEYERRLTEVREQFDVAKQEQLDLQQRLRETERERDEAIAAHNRCRNAQADNNNNNDGGGGADARRVRELTEENATLKSDLKRVRKERNEYKGVIDSFADAEEAEQRQRRKERDRKK